MISLGADTAPFTGRSNLTMIVSYQKSHCCLCHEAGVPGSYSLLLRETGC